MAARPDTLAGPHVPDVVEPPPGHRRFPLFDGLRAIAVVSVVVFHAATASGVVGDRAVLRPLEQLDIGVAIFFLISGFLLYRPYVVARRGGAAAPAPRDYARRRALRILPAYWLALTLLAIWPGLDGVFSGDWWTYYGLLQIYPIHARVSCLNCGIGPAWSLAVEVSFYALLPLLTIALGRLTRGLPTRAWLRRELAILGVLGALSLAFKGWALSRWPENRDLFALHTSLLGTFAWFALGMGLAVWSVAVDGRGSSSRLTRAVARRPLLSWALAAAIFVSASIWVLPREPLSYDAWRVMLEQATFGVVAALLLLPAVFEGDGRGLPRRVLAAPAVAWAGLVSYGVFLWHHELLTELVDDGVLDWAPVSPFLALAALTLAVSLVAAAASYYLVERPLLRFKNRPLLPALRRRSVHRVAERRGG